FEQVLLQVLEKPEAPLVHQVLLRAMSRAQYSPENIGHFGLAYPAYTHFTSPIRRYPDLLLHRMISWQLSREKTQESSPYSYDEMRQLGEQCSQYEQRADNATRDVMLWLKCEYMLDKLGESYAGVISGVTGFGFFVTLENIWVDGLVHIATLPNDYYVLDASTQSLVGERAGKRYRLGDKVSVHVSRVNLDERKIDLEVL
ncbi:MAG: RNB domain-containing ribonuclease, partial [Gammaproteobacteria bacterium]